jgi:hypothetical protein
MVSLDEVLNCLSAWKDAGARLDLSITRPSSEPYIKNLLVGIFDISEDSVALRWFTDTFDSPPKRSFEHTDGTTVVSLEDAEFSISETPVRSLRLTRAGYRCVLREIR